MSAHVSSCLRFVARFCTTRVLLSVIGLSSSDISRIRLYLDRIVAIGGFSGLLVNISGRNRLNFHDRSSEGVSDQ